MEVRRLEVPGIEELVGAGVFYGAALTEAATYRDRDVFVVGGANSAGQGAMFFSRYARTRHDARARRIARVEHVAVSDRSHRRHEERRGPDAVGHHQRARQRQTRGDHRLRPRRGHAREVAADALFIFIGTAPRTEMVAGLSSATRRDSFSPGAI